MNQPFRILILIVALLRAACGEPQPTARTSVSTAGEIWTGQMVTLRLDLRVPGYFAGSPAFDLPRVPGVLILPPAGSPVLSTEQVDGADFTVQQHELMIVPQISGTVTVPAFEIRVDFKRNALDRDAVRQAVTTERLTIEVKRPPGADGSAGIITSRDLQVEESWKPEPSSRAKTGDAFVRTVTWTADDLPGMAFPPLKIEPIAGLGIYPGEPVVADNSDRGDFHGKRTDTVTYVCKAGGHFVIPARTVSWWDPVAKEMKHAGFPARAFDVPVPPAPPVTPKVRLKRAWREHASLIIGATGGIVAVALILRFFKAELVSFARRFRPRHLSPLNPSCVTLMDSGP